MLSASLIICSLKRLPFTWRLMARPKVELEETGFKNSPDRRSLTLRLSPAEAAPAVAGSLAKGGYRVREGERDGDRFLFGQKGAYSRLGIYTTHFSIIIIFSGGILGSLFGLMLLPPRSAWKSASAMRAVVFLAVNYFILAAMHGWASLASQYESYSCVFC